MTAAELQQLNNTEDSVQGGPSSSNEPTNAHSIAQRSTASPTSTLAERRRAPNARVPPPAPSPPSLSSRRSPPKTHIPVSSHQPATMTTKGIESQSQWLFTEEEVRNSPSVQDGLTVAEEVSRRAKGVNFILQAGIILKIPQLTLGTASIFFHRFHMRYSMVPEKGGIHHYVRSSHSRSKYFLFLNKSLTALSWTRTLQPLPFSLRQKQKRIVEKRKRSLLPL